MQLTIPSRGVLAWALFIGLAANCCAQGYKVSLIVDPTMAIPGGTSNFSPWGFLNPSTDGRYVVFENLNPVSIYTYDTKTSQFAKIADLNSVAPGGTALFTGFFYGYNNPNAPLVANGVVVFWGSYGLGVGIYSAPAAGGALKLIVNTGMAAPGGGTFTNNFTYVTTDGAKVAFEAVTSTGSTGTYTFNVDGTTPTRIGDSSVVVDSGGVGVGYDDWYFPSISNGEVAVLAVVGAGDPSRTQNAIFTTPYTGITSDVYPYTGAERPTETVSTTNLPGNTDTGFHTRFDSFALSNSTLGIFADDPVSSYTGIFFAPAAPGQVNAPLTKIVDSVDNPTILFDHSLGISNDNGTTIAFAARDGSNNDAVAVYAWTSGTGTNLVAELGTPVANRPGTTVAALLSGLGLNGAAGGAIAFASNAAGAVYLAIPNVTAITAVSTAFGGAPIAQNTWTQINGNNLVPATTPAAGVVWNNAPSFASGQLPTQLNGISVTVNGKPAFVYFFCSAATSPVCPTDQINVLTPLDPTIGPVQVVVTNGTTASPPFIATMQAVAPTFLLFSVQGYIEARHTDGTLLGPTTLYPGASTPVMAGDTAVIYPIGFGLPTTTVINGSATQSGLLPNPVICMIGGTNAPVIYAAVIEPGLYQLNLTVPMTAPSGDNSITCSYNGISTPAGLITVQ